MTEACLSFLADNGNKQMPDSACVRSTDEQDQVVKLGTSASSRNR